MESKSIDAAYEAVKKMQNTFQHDIVQKHFEATNNKAMAEKSAIVTIDFMIKMTTDKLIIFILNEIKNNLIK